ncbi:hypothetical protein Tco_1027053, partial [Tanacetum coccineum]
MVAYLKKTEGSEGFHQIVDFLNTGHIRSPTHTHKCSRYAAITGLDVRLGGATTTVTGLEAGQGSGNIDKTPTMPHDSPLLRVHTLRSDEGRIQHNELMDLVTKLSDRVVALETDLTQTKKVYGVAFIKLIKRVKSNSEIARTELEEVEQQRIDSYTLQLLRGYSFDEIKSLFEETMKRVNTFTPMDSDVDKTFPKIVAGSSKRDAKEELGQESSKRQKIGESSQQAKEPDELSQEELQQLMIIVFEDMLKTFDRDDLVKLWSLVQEMFNSTEPIKDKEIEIWVELKRLFEPNADDELWMSQKHIHDITWRLYDTCGVHHVSIKDGMDIYMLVEREYPFQELKDQEDEVFGKKPPLKTRFKFHKLDDLEYSTARKWESHDQTAAKNKQPHAEGLRTSKLTAQAQVTDVAFMSWAPIIQMKLILLMELVLWLTTNSPASTQVSTASTQVSTANLSDDTVYAFCHHTRWDTLQGNAEGLGTKIAGTGIRQLKSDYDEVPTNMDLMAFQTIDRVHNDKTCPKTYLKSFETLKTQLDDLRIEFNKYEFNLANYKRGLASVEEQLVFYKKNDVIFCEQLVILKRNISYKDSEISVLKGSQIPDKSRKGLGFHEFEGYGPKPSKSVSEDTSNEIKESPDTPLVEKLVLDDKLEKKTVFLNVAKIEFVRAKQQVKQVRKPV